MATADPLHRHPEPQRYTRVQRFTVPERLAHWNHALTFLTLLVTGGALVVRGATGLISRDTLLLFADIHRVGAVLFTLVTIPVLVLGARRRTGEWVQSAFRFDGDDRRFLARFWREFFGLRVDLPDQGKFNAGEKINSLLQLIGWPIMVATGWILFFKSAFPPGVIRWLLPVHSFTALALGAAVIGHIYLATLHPHSRPALPGMFTGWVPAAWARSHHRKWVDALPPDERR